MIPSEAKGANVQALFLPKNCANTAEASAGGWLSTLGMVGTLLIIQKVGVAAGNVTGSLLTSANSNGAGNAALTFDDGNNFTATAGNTTEAKTVDVNKSKGYVHYVGTLAAAAAVDATMLGRPKETA
jgi:hypothetical protein